MNQSILEQWNVDKDIDNVDYSRSATVLQTAEAAKRERWYTNDAMLIIVGCGGIGFWAGIYAAMMGFFTTIALFDEDKIEPTNIARIPVPGTWAGVNKAVALKRVIHTLRPTTVVLPVLKMASSELLNMLLPTTRNRPTYVLDCTDDARAQNDIYNWTKSGRLTDPVYAKAGYEGVNFGIYTEINSWVPEGYRPGYRTAASNVLSSAAAAAYAISSLMFRGNTADSSFSLLDGICTKQRKSTIIKAMQAIQTGQNIERLEEVNNA